MKLSNYLKPALIKVDLESEDKEELFEEMVQIFVDEGIIHDREAALEAVLMREEKMTTGIAKWLAIPHGKVKEAKEVSIVVGISKDGVEYDSLDGEPVHVVLMVFSEEGNPGPHIEALAEISRLFSIPGFTAKMCDVESPQEVINLISKEE